LSLIENENIVEMCSTVFFHLSHVKSAMDMLADRIVYVMC